MSKLGKTKRLLRKEYLKLCAMERRLSGADCGISLQEYIFPSLGKQRSKVHALYKQCLDLEGTKENK